ncbi:MAG: MMPL family transporter [Clostridiales bacterium]|nr:MMPL family transporter [Clostridiales bacterium]
MISKIVTEHNKIVVIIFAVLTLVCTALIPLVNTNYNMLDYLPEDVSSTIAIEIMADEFTEDMPNTRVMIDDVTLTEALQYKQRLAEIPGITSVMWLDDVADIQTPIEIGDADTVEAYYKDGKAVFEIAVESGSESEVYTALSELVDGIGAVSGNAVNIAVMQDMTVTEVTSAIIILVPIIIVLLVLTSNSWIEPLLFLGAIGVAVLINMGTNAFLPSVSNITMSISPILQLAVSLDYAIFLLHSYERHCQETDDVKEAMRRAMRSAFSSVTASAMTTLFGFVALLFMRFGLGADLGLNLVKGVALSYISIMLFLPAFTLCMHKLLIKTRHKRIIPQMKGVGKGLMKIRYPVLILAFILVVPSFLAQRNNSYTYGRGDVAAERQQADTHAIEETFGKSNPIVILVPTGDIARENEMCEVLGEVQNISGVVSYAGMVGTAIPNEFLEESVTSNFSSESYSRIIVYADTAEEGEEAFLAVETVRSIISEYYDTFYTSGQSAALYDMKSVIEADSIKVNIIAIVAIALVVAITFRSVSLPIILLCVIESAIWINLAIPYFTGTPLVYIGYLVINTVQLGATIDYAILLTDTYKRFRMHLPKLKAMKTAIGECFLSILTSAIILSAAGFCLALTTSNSMVEGMGILLCRGTILSFLMVLCALPGLLLVLDKVIAKTTANSLFHKEGSKNA